MNTIRDLINRVKQAKADMIANRETDALVIAFDLLALIKLRIQTKGQNADGAQFAPYTPEYSRSRKKAGYQVEFVDFTRTGRTMANIRPVVVRSNVFSCTVSIEGIDPKTKLILRGFYPKRGNILEASEAEQKLVREANLRRYQKYFNF